MSEASKEAVVFILDANPSMNKEWGAATTRLECAKQAIESMIFELMLNSKTNEVDVIITKTEATQHHKVAVGIDLEEENPPFANITELCNGIQKPQIDLLRRLSKVQTAKNAENLQGDLVSALILAGEAHFQRKKQKFRRTIVLITDAEHDFVAGREVDVFMEEMRNMDCRLQVIGLDFASSAVFDEPIVKKEISPDKVPSNKLIKTEEDADAAVQMEEDSGAGVKMEEGAEDDEDDVLVYKFKEDREEWLKSLAEITGGEVLAASSVQEVLEANKGKRTSQAFKTKFDLRIAPGLSVPARHLKMISTERDTTTKLHKRVVVTDDETKEPMLDDTHAEVTEKSIVQRLWVDPDEPDVVVDLSDTTTAVAYGSTLVPLSAYDLESLASVEKAARLEILGYMDRDEIPIVYLSGPPYAITGHESQKSCAAISALAQALQQLNRVAIGSLYKSSRSKKPTLVSIFPYEQDPHHPMRLLFLDLPFSTEAKKIQMTPFETDDEKARVCDDLVDAMMLDDDFDVTVPNAFTRSWHQTLFRRALDPKAEVVVVMKNELPSVSERAQSALKAFDEAFVVKAKPKPKQQAATKDQNGKNVLTYTNFV